MKPVNEDRKRTERIARYLSGRMPRAEAAQVEAAAAADPRLAAEIEIARGAKAVTAEDVVRATASDAKTSKRRVD